MSQKGPEGTGDMLRNRMNANDMEVVLVLQTCLLVGIGHSKSGRLPPSGGLEKHAICCTTCTPVQFHETATAPSDFPHYQTRWLDPWGDNVLGEIE